MAETIAPLKYGRIIGRFMAAVGDTKNDVDEFPDAVPLTGTITLTPAPPAIIVAAGKPDPVTVLPMPITLELDAQGYIGLNAKRGVYVIATDDPSTTPTGWTYGVSFGGLRYEGSIVKYASFNIHVPADGVVDLSLVAPVVNTGGTAVVADTTVLNSVLATFSRSLDATIAASEDRNDDAIAASEARTGTRLTNVDTALKATLSSHDGRITAVDGRVTQVAGTAAAEVSRVDQRITAGRAELDLAIADLAKTTADARLVLNTRITGLDEELTGDIAAVMRAFSDADNALTASIGALNTTLSGRIAELAAEVEAGGGAGTPGPTGPAGPAGGYRLLAKGATSGPSTDPAGTIWAYPA